MKGILIDTSDKFLSVGLVIDNTIVDEISYEAWQRQSERLIVEIDTLLKRNKVTRSDLSFVCATKGPGSYTGVRIALTVAKVMAFALGIKLYLVSSLEALKLPSAPSIALMNARANRSYIGVYNGKDVLLSDRAMNNNEVFSYIEKHPDYSLVGDLSYLGLESKNVKTLQNLLLLSDESHLVSDVLGAKPTYLKDLT